MTTYVVSPGNYIELRSLDFGSGHKFQYRDSALPHLIYIIYPDKGINSYNFKEWMNQNYLLSTHHFEIVEETLP